MRRRFAEGPAQLWPHSRFGNITRDFDLLQASLNLIILENRRNGECRFKVGNTCEKRNTRMLRTRSGEVSPPTYNVGDVPEDLEAEDGVPQEEVNNVIAHKRTERGTLIDEFYGNPPTPLKLSMLQNQYEQGKEHLAMLRLKRRHKVEVDGTFLHNIEDPDLAWGATDHYLDFILLVSSKQGLHALLPRSVSDHSYTFVLDVHQPHRLWRVRHAELGFNPTGRMLYLGTYFQEEIWLAMVPRSFTDEDSNEDPDMTPLCGRTTSLSERHYCMLIAFLATQLQLDGFKDIVVRDRYPRPLTTVMLKTVTNLL